MRIYLTLILAIMLFSPSISTPKVMPRPEKMTVQIYKAVRKLQPALSPSQAQALAVAVRRNTVAIGLDWRIAVAILNQESSLKLDPQNCKVDFTRCNDMGIGQVRYSVWGKKLNINKKRMVTDITYAVDKSFEVLAYYKAQYEHRDLQWYTRYHSMKNEHRELYFTQLNRSYAKMNLAKD